MNPYKTLNIDYRADKRGIIEAVALAMRERKFSVQEVAIAQKELLNPIDRAAHDFLQFIDVKSLQEQLILSKPQEQTVFDLNRLSIFDENS
jgi:hypothetical protein